MARDDILERIDEHMTRGNEHMARGNELMTRIVELHEDQRQFIREITRRNEVVMRELTSEVVAGRQVLIDLHAESQSQHGAILALIDELRSGGLRPNR